MKKLFIILFSALSLTAFAQNDVKRVAILETVDRVGDVSLGVKNLLRQSITFGINRIPGYEGYNRVDMAQINSEHNFQRTGYVSDADIKKLGVMTGASYVLIAEATTYDAEHILVFANLVDVESGRITNSSIPKVAGIAPDKMYADCAEVAKSLLGGDRTSLQDGKKIYNTENIVINQALLQERGFVFSPYYRQGIAKIILKDSNMSYNIICSNPEYYDHGVAYGGHIEEGRPNGLFYLENEEKVYLMYICYGKVVYPLLKSTYYDGGWCISLQYEDGSHGCMFPSWKGVNKYHSRACSEMKKLFNEDIESEQFIYDMYKMKIPIESLENQFINFLKRGEKLNCKKFDNEYND